MQKPVRDSTTRLEVAKTLNALRVRSSPIHCSTHPTSRRRTPKAALTLDDKLVQLRAHRHQTCVSIDGQTGTGKSTLSASIRNRTRSKINALVPYLTAHNRHNWMPLLSWQYMMGQLCGTVNGYVVLDRSPWANYVFYFVHHLMHLYGDQPIPVEPATVWPHMVAFARDVHADATLTFTIRLTPNGRMPVVFLVSSCPDIPAFAMLERGIATNHPNDVHNAGNRNYLMAQYHAYGFLAQLLKDQAILIDMAVMLKLGYSYGDVHTFIAACLAPPDVESSEQDGLAIGPNDAEQYVENRTPMSFESCILHSKK